MYGDGSRALQDHFDTRRLADRLAEITLHDALTDDDRALIGAQSTVWIATVDGDGWPDVSYKGGDVGFVRVTGPTELRIPSYDGNGMFRTLGNVVANGRVALLFVDPGRPWRLRIHGRGRVSTDPSDTAQHVGSQAVLVVTVVRAFPNCGRYIHPPDAISAHVPAVGHEPPTPGWKRHPDIVDVLPRADLGDGA